MRYVLCALALTSCAALAESSCKNEGDLSSLAKEQRVAFQALFGGLTTSAIVRDFGTYQIITSTDPRTDTILILRRHLPFLTHSPGFGITVFEATADAEPTVLLTVQDRKNEGHFRRLGYALHDANGKPIGAVLDHAMTGSIEVLRFDPAFEGGK